MTLSSKPEGIELQQRDLELLRGLYESRVMTLVHAALLYFDDKSEAAKKRVQKLKTAGLISERPRRVYEPSILALTRKGNQVLASHGLLSGFPQLSAAAVEKRARVSEITLRHELDVMDVKTAIVSGVRNTSGFQIDEFTTWPILNEFRASQPDGNVVTMKPDGFIRIREETENSEFEHTFFLEVDRSTETQDRLGLKAFCYRDYYRQGGLALKNGRLRTEFEQFPFRVLMIFRTAERRNNACEMLLRLHPPILTQVWLTTMTEVAAHPLAAIWITSSDYQHALARTRFEALTMTAPLYYRRATDRDSLINSRAQKRSLLADS